LPKWIVESSNGYYILALYGLLFGVLLPAIVGRWWYGTRSVTKEGIETETASRYFQAVKETAGEQDVIDILASSHEYEVYLKKNESLDVVGLEKKLSQANVSISCPAGKKASEVSLPIRESNIRRL
jgi:translocation protein SEC63